jgi:hypothetical protein
MGREGSRRTGCPEADDYHICPHVPFLFYRRLKSHFSPHAYVHANFKQSLRHIAPVLDHGRASIGFYSDSQPWI